MHTKLSTKGQVVLPSPIRRSLGIRTGDSLDASVEGGRVVLTPRTQRLKARILVDTLTGLPVLSAQTGEPLLTTKQVREILSSLP